MDRERGLDPTGQQTMHFVVSLLNFRPGLVGGGAETYVRALVRNLPHAIGNDRATVILYRANADAIETPGLERLVIDSGDRALMAMRFAEAVTPWRARNIERAIQRLEPDAILFPQQSMFPKTRVAPTLLTVLDIQHLFFPEYFSLAHRIFRDSIYETSLRRADRILAISEFTRNNLIERCRVAPEKVVAVPLGFDPPETRTDSAPEPEEPYLYFPAATFPHKGHRALLRSIAALRDRPEGFPWRLVLTGQRTGYWKTIRNDIERLRLEDMVEHRGFVSREEVTRLYRTAAAVLFPTEFEGFGLPVIEAASYNRPIIASRLAVFDEIGLPPSCQIDFADPEQLRSALQDLRPISLLSAPLSWTQHTQRTIELLRQNAQRT